MAYTSDSGFQYGPVSDETAQKIQELVGEKGTVIGSVGIDIGQTGVTDAATTTHHVTTSVYVDGAGHAHILVIDEVTSAGGMVLEILADVQIN